MTSSTTAPSQIQLHPQPQPVDTTITGLTYVCASNSREVENLVTREFHADPNLHKNSNVELVGDYSTNGSPSVTFEWIWKWKPPRATEDRGGGWRNHCSVCSLFLFTILLSANLTICYPIANQISSLSSTIPEPTVFMPWPAFPTLFQAPPPSSATPALPLLHSTLALRLRFESPRPSLWTRA